MPDRLKSGPRYDLWEWVEKNVDTVINATDKEAARLASELLGFTVRDSHIVAARKRFGINRRRALHAEGVRHG